MKERKDVIDMIRGIAIFLVVAVHSRMPIAFENILNSFGMPLFFTISGYLFNIQKYNGNFKLLMKNRTRSLIAPYLIGSILSYSYWIITKFIGEYKESFIWYKPLLGVLSGNIGTLLNFPLWFLLCLFSSQCIFYIFLKYFKGFHTTIKLGLIFFMGLTGYLLCRVIILPWGLDIALIAQLFLFLGYWIRENKIKLQKVNRNFWSVLLLLYILHFQPPIILL